MRNKPQRPPVATGGVEVGIVPVELSADPTTSGPASAAPPEAAGPVGRYRMVDAVPFHDRLLVGWDDISVHTGLSRRLLEREVSAGRMPGPDVRIGRRACWRPATITAWLDSLADRQGRRSRP